MLDSILDRFKERHSHVALAFVFLFFGIEINQAMEFISLAHSVLDTAQLVIAGAAPTLHFFMSDDAK